MEVKGRWIKKQWLAADGQQERIVMDVVQHQIPALQQGKPPGDLANVRGP